MVTREVIRRDAAEKSAENGKGERARMFCVEAQRLMVRSKREERHNSYFIILKIFSLKPICQRAEF